MIASVRLGASRVGVARSRHHAAHHKLFQFLFSGMENALGFAVLSFMLHGLLLRAVFGGGPTCWSRSTGPARVWACCGVIAMIDLAVHHETVAIGTGFVVEFVALLAVVAFCRSSPLWALNSTPFADTLEIKRLTAPNWGAYHERCGRWRTTWAQHS